MSPVRHLRHNPAYWSIRRKTVVRRFSPGLVVSFTPIPVHTLIGYLGFNLLWRVSLADYIVARRQRNSPD